MTTEEVKKYLVESGYKVEPPPGFENHHVVINAYKRTSGPDCKTNERPPSMRVKVILWDEIYSEGQQLSVDFNLRAESQMGIWVNLGWYGMSVKEFIENRETQEYLLEKMWRMAA